MAYFKITLLTPYSNFKAVDDTDFYDSYFLEDTITEFYSQLDSYQENQNSEKQLIEYQDKELQEQTNKTLFVGSDEYDFKKRTSTTSFTYNEQVSFSLNSQKTLTFSMNKYIIRQDEVLENPFINLIQNLRITRSSVFPLPGTAQTD